MDTQNQFFVFAICLCTGFLGGILYEPFSAVRWLCGCRRGKRKPLAVALDIVFSVLFAAFSIFMAYAFRFPDFRAYMWLGYGLGGIIYLKTLHKILAFLQNMCYNKVTKLVKKAKDRKKTLQKEVEKV